MPWRPVDYVTYRIFITRTRIVIKYIFNTSLSFRLLFAPDTNAIVNQYAKIAIVLNL